MSIMGIIKKLFIVLSDRKTAASFILYALAAVVILGVPTALVQNPVFHRMIQSTPLDYVFLFTTSILAAAYLAIPAAACGHDGKAAGGSVLGVLAFACPICDVLLVLLFGASFLLSFFNPLRPIIGVLSVLVLAYAVSQKLEMVPASAKHH